MRKITYRFAAILCLSGVAWNCSAAGGSSDNDNDLALLGLAWLVLTTPGCATFPTTVTYNQMAPSAVVVNYACTVSGLVLTCTATNATAGSTYTFPSVEAARLSVFSAPAFAGQDFMHGFRGTKIQNVNPAVVFTLTLDGSNRVTAGATNLGGSWTLSNHDANGFYQTMTGSSSSTLTYAYGEGGTRPTRIQSTSGTTLDYKYSQGLMTSGNYGTYVTTMTTSGTQQMCQ